MLVFTAPEEICAATPVKSNFRANENISSMKVRLSNPEKFARKFDFTGVAAQGIFFLCGNMQVIYFFLCIIFF
jgi:hypothetical protein